MTSNQQFIIPAGDAATLLGALPDVALVLDAMGRIDFASAGSARYLGLRPREWVGLSALDHLHPDDLEGFVERLKLAQARKETPTQALSLRISAGAGEWRLVAAHGFVAIDINGLTGTLVMLRDATSSPTREVVHRTALQTVFDQEGSRIDMQRDDRTWIATELLPSVLNHPDPNGELLGVVVMTLSPGPNEPHYTNSGAVENPVGALAQRIRQVLRPRDFLARLGETQLVVLCTGLANTDDGFEVARRLHRWCSNSHLGDSSQSSLSLSTGCAFATLGDNTEDVLAYASSDASKIECGRFLLTAA